MSRIYREVKRLEKQFNTKAVQAKPVYMSKGVRYLFMNGIEVYQEWKAPFDIMICLRVKDDDRDLVIPEPPEVLLVGDGTKETGSYDEFGMVWGF